jgi:Peptidase family M23
VKRQTLLRVAVAGLGIAAGLAVLRTELTAQAQDGAAFALKGQLTQGGWARGVAPRDAKALSFNGRRVPLAPDGGFFIAFDRDSPPKGELRAELEGGTSAVGAIAIAPRAWKLEHIAIGPRPGAAPSEEFARRRAGELALINAARRKEHDVAGWRQKFIWPVYGRISGRFGSQRIYNGTPGSYHSGIDIATGTSGTPFVAPADGVVLLAAATSFTLEGRLLMIDHGMGLNSAFLHASKLVVKEGDVVRQGQYIGNIGATGRATGPHLHWSLKWNEARLDPLLFTGGDK